MQGTINKHVRSCHQCHTKRCSTIKPSGNLRSLSPPDPPFKRVGINFLGSFLTSALKNRLIIVVVDHLTRYAKTKAVFGATTHTATNFFIHQIRLRHGALKILLSDRGTPFPSMLKAGSPPFRKYSTWNI